MSKLKNALVRVFVPTKAMIGKLICGAFSVLPLQDKVVFSNFSGKCYGDNPRYISEKLHENNPDIQIVWLQHKGYTFDAIQQIQRMYFHYSSNYSKYEIDDLLEKLEACFPSNGTTPEALTDTAKEVFGHVREDGFPFVFEDAVVAEFSFYFCDVKPYFNEELSEEDEMICIFDIWHSEENAEYERNLELWCHKIVKDLQKKNMDDEAIIAAQILYAASLADTEYRATLIDDLVLCFADDAMYDITVFNDKAYEIFGINIEDNVPLMEYLNEVME